MSGEYPDNVLALPVRVVGRMRHGPYDPRQLVKAVRAHVVACRTSAQKLLIVIVIVTRSDYTFATLPGLPMNITEHRIAKSSKVKPIISHPAVNQRTFGHCCLERRVRIEQCHCNRETFIGGPNHADSAIRFLYMFYQPFDRVPRI